MVMPIIWCYMQLQSPNSTLQYTTCIFKLSLTKMSFIYYHLNFHDNLLRPWRFPLKNEDFNLPVNSIINPLIRKSI
jgi:hypothetical protein